MALSRKRLTTVGPRWRHYDANQLSVKFSCINRTDVIIRHHKPHQLACMPLGTHDNSWWNRTSYRSIYRCQWGTYARQMRHNQ